ncbi:MAG: DUF2924 domain-containing protein [Salaquimonas sp.]
MPNISKKDLSPAVDERSFRTLSLEDLSSFDRDHLVRLWQAHFKEAPPRSISRPLMLRILAFELQASRYGGLSPTIKRRIVSQANVSAKKPVTIASAGTRYIREWNGATHIVEVTGQGYQWQGNIYRSLSAIAKAITGAHWSGPRFFASVKERTS